MTKKKAVATEKTKVSLFKSSFKTKLCFAVLKRCKRTNWLALSPWGSQARNKERRKDYQSIHYQKIVTDVTSFWPIIFRIVRFTSSPWCFSSGHVFLSNYLLGWRGPTEKKDEKVSFCSPYFQLVRFFNSTKLLFIQLNLYTFFSATRFQIWLSVWSPRMPQLVKYTPLFVIIIRH